MILESVFRLTSILFTLGGSAIEVSSLLKSGKIGVVQQVVQYCGYNTDWYTTLVKQRICAITGFICIFIGFLLQLILFLTPVQMLNSRYLPIEVLVTIMILFGFIIYTMKK